jgi:hypothetical protein
MAEDSVVNTIEPVQRLNLPNAALIYPSRLEPGKIRVIILRKGNQEDGISCSLEEVSLDERIQYEALSYCWGDQENPATITLNSHQFHVTQNLACALKYLRLQIEDRRL